MKQLINYTIAEFLTKKHSLVESYLIYLENLNASNILIVENKKYRCNSIWDLPYYKVDALKDIFSENENINPEIILNAFTIVFGISIQQILKIPIIDFYAALNFIKKEVKNIITAENENLQFEPDPKLVAAGIERLNQFGVLNIIDSLAGGDLLKWEDVEKQPYRKIHYKLWRDNIINDVNSKYYKQ